MSEQMIARRRGCPITAALLPWLLAACSQRSDAPPPVAQADPAPGPASALAMLDAAMDAETDLREHMREHLAAVVRVQEAIVRGQLDQVRRDGAWLIIHPEHVELADAAADVERLRAAAVVVAEAKDLPAAAAGLAALGSACASCHDARGAIATFEWEPEPPDEASLAAQMRRHQWAAARLWQGVVGPSDELWRQGSSALSTLRLHVGSLADGPSGPAVKAAVARVRALATQAQNLRDPARTALYGELLTTCVGCHQEVRPGPRPMP